MDVTKELVCINFCIWSGRWPAVDKRQPTQWPGLRWR